MGGFFILLGVALTLWSRKEKKRYYNSMVLTRREMKEFMSHEPERSWLSAWQIGGRISLTIGIMLAIAGGVLWLTQTPLP